MDYWEEKVRKKEEVSKKERKKQKKVHVDLLGCNAIT
jgi:hypothetical protein